MLNGLVISDAGPIFSLAVISRLDILDSLFENVVIPKAVWDEITVLKSVPHYTYIESYFRNKVRNITGPNNLHFVMDYGESEALLLYKELDANFLLIDDKKARDIAENLGIQCVGTLGVLSAAKSKELIPELKPIFEIFLAQKRYYSLNILNSVLRKHGEKELNDSFI